MKAQLLKIITAIAWLGVASNVVASSSEAWALHDQEVISACIKASELVGAKPAGQVVRGDDSLGFDFLVLQGKSGNAQSLALCAFNKKDRRAEVSEADALIQHLGKNCSLYTK